MVDITNVVNVSVSQQPRGLGFYNVNNVMLFADEQPIVSFGSDKYRDYINARDVAKEWGTNSKAAKMASLVFSQQQNPLSGGGQLLIAPMLASIPGVAASGSIKFVSNPVADNTLTIGSTVYTFSAAAGSGKIELGADLASTLENVALIADSSVTAASDGVDTVTFTAKVAGVTGNSITVETNVADASPTSMSLSGGVDAKEAESLSDAITRLYESVYFGGCFTTKACDKAEYIAAALTVQSLDTILVINTPNVSDMQTGGLLETLFAQSYSKTKGILYTVDTDNSISAAYVGRAFSTNYNAQNSCSTMNLKDLVGMPVDTGISQTIFSQAKAVGCDLYTDVEGLPKVFSNSNQGYFDEIYNRLWFVQYVKVVLFNALATVRTKIPQTEAGMNTLKNAVKKACELGIYNNFLAPGTWNGSETFGNPDDFYRNISDYGFFIYSMPIAQQAQADREQRVAPVLQVAAKESGSIHSASLLIYFQA